MNGYRGFESKELYEKHYGNVANYADEISSMEAYTKECVEEREMLEQMFKKETEMDEIHKRLKLDCIAIAASECYDYDDKGRRVSLTAEEIVNHAEAFFKFLNNDGAKNV
jgi:hypothetical protein